MPVMRTCGCTPSPLLPGCTYTQAALCQIAGRSRLVAQRVTQADAVFYAAGCSSQIRNGAMQNKGEGVGASYRKRGRKKGRKKGSLFGEGGDSWSRREKREKRRGSGGLLMCFGRGEWGGHTIFDQVAQLVQPRHPHHHRRYQHHHSRPCSRTRWYFTAWVRHPFSRPLPDPCVISACQISACNRLVNSGKRPDERRRRRPRAVVIEQGMHPHPGPTIYDIGFDDSDGGDWGEDALSQSDSRGS